MISGNCTSSPENIINRVILFIEIIKGRGVDIEGVTGMSKQARQNYKIRLNIPATKTLFAWSTDFDLSVDWLLHGEGSMFISERKGGGRVIKDATTQDSVAHRLLSMNEELRSQLLKLTSENASLKTKLELIESMGKQSQDSDAKHVFGEGSVAHTSQDRTE